MMRWFLLGVWIVSSQAATAQLTSAGIIYPNEFQAGAFIHTAGWGLVAELGRWQNATIKNFWSFEFTQLHHPKEIKQTIDFGFPIIGINSPRPFFYGKEHSFYLLNVAYGRYFLLAEKARRAGVEVGLRVCGGLSLGLLKPYYLNLLYPTDNSGRYEIRPEKYSEQNAARFLDFFSIYGGAGFTFGLDEIKPVPGMHLLSGFQFDWAQNDQSIKALETGLRLNIYYKKIPLMLTEPNHWFFINFYIAMRLGKKW